MNLYLEVRYSTKIIELCIISIINLLDCSCLHYLIFRNKYLDKNLLENSYLELFLLEHRFNDHIEKMAIVSY